MSLPSVSVVIPCYNYGHFIDDAVDSVLAQTLPDFDIIVVNDGSTDPDTVSKLSNYSKPKCRVLHSENKGPAAARNLGISASQAQYILPLDADDRIAPRYLELARAALEADADLGIVYCQAEYFGRASGKVDLPPYSFPEILITPQVFCSALFRRRDWEQVGGYCSDFLHGWEDYDFWLSLIGLGRKVHQIPEVLFYYRKHEKSRSDNMTPERRAGSVELFIKRHPKMYLENLDKIAKRH